ncbi:MAG: TRAP transporter substrate-binding protein [Tropicimonas sp.]|uniref:TRAP transporter substrate-binding protein n=1 Tax=Tropicimonas sp. TaxID=2067044 RepID=UPI003A8B1957
MTNLLRRTLLASALAIPAALLSPLPALAATNLTFATAYAGGDGQIGQTMEKLKELAAEKSGGSLNVELFFDSTLGTERELLEALVTGAGDMSMAGISDVVYWMPEYFLSVPYLFESVEHVRAVYDGPIGQEIDQLMLEKKGLRTLAIMNRGARHVSSNRRIEHPADMSGLRLRLPENPLWIAIWKQLGVNATTISYNELYTALQTGVVEAQENPLESIVNSKFYEVQDYVVLTGHVRDVYKIQISEKTWARLTPEEQTALQEAAKEAALFGDGLLASSEENSLKVLAEAGTEVIEVDPAEFSDAMSDSKNIADQFLKPGLYQMVKDARP